MSDAHKSLLLYLHNPNLPDMFDNQVFPVLVRLLLYSHHDQNTFVHYMLDNGIRKIYRDNAVLGVIQLETRASLIFGEFRACKYRKEHIHIGSLLYLG